ncbi:MAG: hypothetical protein DRP22_00855 [Verrucomicrobia bacterium]|nr:MAG: hypothetical protein DRP22_00855 [Verrucomicrobiota bacterium]
MSVRSLEDNWPCRFSGLPVLVPIITGTGSSSGKCSRASRASISARRAACKVRRVARVRPAGEVLSFSPSSETSPAIRQGRPSVLKRDTDLTPLFCWSVFFQNRLNPSPLGAAMPMPVMTGVCLISVPGRPPPACTILFIVYIFVHCQAQHVGHLQNNPQYLDTRTLASLVLTAARALQEECAVRYKAGNRDRREKEADNGNY